MNKTAIMAVLAGIALLSAHTASAGCTTGESRCGADGYVERCTSNGTWNSSMLKCAREGDGRYGRDRPSGGYRCTPGESQCGADGYVERCTPDGTWDSSMLKCRR